MSFCAFHSLHCVVLYALLYIPYLCCLILYAFILYVIFHIIQLYMLFCCFPYFTLPHSLCCAVYYLFKPIWICMLCCVLSNSYHYIPDAVLYFFYLTPSHFAHSSSCTFPILNCTLHCELHGLILYFIFYNTTLSVQCCPFSLPHCLILYAVHCILHFTLSLLACTLHVLNSTTLCCKHSAVQHSVLSTPPVTIYLHFVGHPFVCIYANWWII